MRVSTSNRTYFGTESDDSDSTDAAIASLHTRARHVCQSHPKHANCTSRLHSERVHDINFFLSDSSSSSSGRHLIAHRRRVLNRLTPSPPFSVPQSSHHWIPSSCCFRYNSDSDDPPSVKSSDSSDTRDILRAPFPRNRPMDWG
jgi:hypothetical protein